MGGRVEHNRRVEGDQGSYLGDGRDSMRLLRSGRRETPLGYRDRRHRAGLLRQGMRVAISHVCSSQARCSCSGSDRVHVAHYPSLTSVPRRSESVRLPRGGGLGDAAVRTPQRSTAYNATVASDMSTVAIGGLLCREDPVADVRFACVARATMPRPYRSGELMTACPLAPRPRETHVP